MKSAMRLYTTIIMTLVVCVQLDYTETGVDSSTDIYTRLSHRHKIQLLSQV